MMNILKSIAIAAIIGLSSVSSSFGQAVTSVPNNQLPAAIIGTTSVTAPLDIGGSGTTGTQKTFKTTTGNGTTDAFAWVGGNNGATAFASLSAAGGFSVSSTGQAISGTTTGNTVAGFTSSQSLSVFNVAGSGGSFIMGVSGSAALMQGAGGVASMQFQVAGGAPTMDIQGGKLTGTAHLSTGTVPIGTTGSCTASSFVGGATAGKFTAAVCAGGTFILSGLPTAPNGYTCNAQDQTTPSDTLKQTANTVSSVTFTSTTVASDVIVFSCMGW